MALPPLGLLRPARFAPLLALLLATVPSIATTSAPARAQEMDSAGTHVLRGQIASVQLGEDGEAAWIQSGIWVMRAQMAESETPRAQFIARFAMVMPDGSAMHSHSVYGFAVDNYSVNGTTHMFEGTATVTLRDGPVPEVPVTVSIFNNTVMVMQIDPQAVDSHFGDGSVYGVLSAASRELIERIPARDLEGEPAPAGGDAELETGMVNYYGNASGYLAQPAQSEGQLPAVVMIHENRGLNDFVKGAADRLAAEGYVVLAADLFNGQVTADQDEARALTAQVRENPEAAIENLNAAVAHLASLENVDGERIASLGWCFGGGFSMQLALNAEQPLAATVIYYGSLVTDQEELSVIEWPVLGIFGSEDQVISVESVEQFEQALDANGIENEIYIYEGVGHAFANPSNAGHAPEETQDAWEKTLAFLSEHV
ncbi:dienelactone hydrolase family protein [Candidatus Nitrososphaera sp. FF02]|uniref:dienelactone hydrolase family protein n=1 Tax=Candidatus Nitrososphaera sp. FF02 TaxID=3398226 RepID=UPI0039E9D9CA